MDYTQLRTIGGFGMERSLRVIFFFLHDESPPYLPMPAVCLSLHNSK